MNCVHHLLLSIQPHPLLARKMTPAPRLHLTPVLALNPKL